MLKKYKTVILSISIIISANICFSEKSITEPPNILDKIETVMIKYKKVDELVIKLRNRISDTYKDESSDVIEILGKIHKNISDLLINLENIKRSISEGTLTKNRDIEEFNINLEEMNQMYDEIEKYLNDRIFEFNLLI